jgi:hypothetical protein
MSAESPPVFGHKKNCHVSEKTADFGRVLRYLCWMNANDCLEGHGSNPIK